MSTCVVRLKAIERKVSGDGYFPKGARKGVGCSQTGYGLLLENDLSFLKKSVRPSPLSPIYSYYNFFFILYIYIFIYSI